MGGGIRFAVKGLCCAVSCASCTSAQLYIQYIHDLRVGYSTAKAGTNRRKHGIDFADAATVFSDEYALTIPDGHAMEDRCITLGMDALGRILVVVFT